MDNALAQNRLGSTLFISIGCDNGMNSFRRLGNILLLSFLIVTFATVLPLGLVLYNTMYQAEQDKIIQIANAALRPVSSLTTRSVNGANKMKLRNKNAQDLYVSAGVLYLSVLGNSKAIPASTFMAAQPPRELKYEYWDDNDDSYFGELADSQVDGYIDESRYLLLLKKQLPEIENGGEIAAVFSAEGLRGLRWKIIQKMILPILGVFVFSFAVAIYLGRKISKPITETSEQISHISQSLNLSMRVESSSSIVEIASTAQMFNQFLEQIENIITRLNQLIEHMNSTAVKLASITNNTQKRVLSQETQSDQVAAAMVEMTAAVGHVSDNAVAAAQSAQGASSETQQGVDVVNQTVLAINELAEGVERAVETVEQVEQESNAIGGVLGVIMGIAEQTNLLALNAAIEAARAGESGRGFAVVADEVRALASRTQESTEEIQKVVERLQTGSKNAISVISSGQEMAKSSVEKANIAGHSLETIYKSISTINDMNAQIVASTSEQSDVAESVSQSINSISELSGQISDDSTSCADSSEKLTLLANQLKELVEEFKLS